MHFEVLIVGAGPAGLAAATAALEAGVSVGVIDDNSKPGGQIWRNEANPHTTSLRATFLAGHRIVDQPAPNALLAATDDAAIEITYNQLILATGARERFLPFPGWTLPGVMGVGGLQAMVKGGLRIARKRVVIAGTGPLLLAVASYLRKRGADILLIAEQAEFASLASFGLSLWSRPAKLRQAIALQWELRDITQNYGSWVVRAEGKRHLESVTFQDGVNHTCDYLAIGYNLVPNTELQQLLGCTLENGFVKVDEWQQTTVAQVYCAGEPTGIGGVDLALIEGRIAGYAATGQQSKARQGFAARAKWNTFRDRMAVAFALRPELRALATPETIVCRCEDVRLGPIREQHSWRSAKLHTRCGMGPCQGRICGPAIEFLTGWQPDSVRPPLTPVTIQQMLGR